MNDRGLRRLVDTLAEGAACRPPVPLGWFFPDPRASGSLVEAAMHVCAGCPVLAACRQYGDRVERGLPKTQLHGVLAGESPLERLARRTGAA